MPRDDWHQLFWRYDGAGRRYLSRRRLVANLCCIGNLESQYGHGDWGTSFDWLHAPSHNYAGRLAVIECIPEKLAESADGTRWRCMVCDFRDIDRAGHFPDRIHRRCPQQLPSWGDRVERWLSRLGITKDRYRAAKRWLGLGGATCGCQERQRKLNAAGWRISRWLARVSLWWH